MNAVKKFKKIIDDRDFIDYLSSEFRFVEIMAKSINVLLDLEKTIYYPDVFRSLMTLLINTDLTDDEKTEVIAYYINKCLFVYEEDTRENRNLYIKKVAFSSEKKYDMLHANLKRIRTVISCDGEILPSDCKCGINEIASIQMYVPIPKQYIKDVLGLSKRKYKEIQKQEQFMKKLALEMTSLINDVSSYVRIISHEEIEKTKRIMTQLNYSEEQKDTVLRSIEISNNFILSKKANLSEIKESKMTNLDLKQQKKLTFELSQYIDLDKNMPYDYLDESEITEISNLLNLLGYPLERVYVILNNIKKNNELEDQRIFNNELVLIKQDIFAEIDEIEDKPFETLANDIYTNALNNETVLEDKNEKINKALSDIDEAINNIINASSEEDKNIWGGYIMELLNDIDKEFRQAWEWNLVRARKDVK